MSIKISTRAIGLSLALVAALVCATPIAAQAPASAPPCSTEEHRRFDFWIGDWVVHAPDGTEAGRNRIEKILNGCVLQENWSGSQGSTGKSFNMYFEREGVWHQTWVDNAGSRLDLTGGWKDGAMTLTGTMPGADGKPVEHEISWTPNDDGTVKQHWRASRDGGASWQDLFVGIYSKSGG